MNAAINVNLIGKGNVESVLKNAGTAVHRFASDAVSSNREMAQSSGQASSAITKIGSAATGTTSPLSRMGSVGVQSNVQIAKSGEAATQSLARTGSMGLNAGNSISRGATVGSKSIDNITRSAENANHGLSEMGNLAGMLMGGYGAMQIATSMWTGATTKQFNAAYLGTKMSTAAANDYITQIQKIVAEVPGDDTFMNNLMTGAVAKQTNLTSSELKMLGIASADYLTVSQNMGKSALETQMDLKEYILTGNTSQLERDSILKQQMSTLEGQGTVSERILALNKALQAEGYAGLSQLDIASIKAEELKGKFQLAGTAIGEKILPSIEKAVDYLLELDEKTGGWSTQIGLAGAGVVALGLALGPIVWSAKEVLSSVTGIGEKLTGITGGKKKIDLECNPCPDDSQVGGSSGKSGKSSGSKSGGIRGSISSVINSLGLTGVMAGTGEAVGVTGAASATLMGILGGATMTAGGYGLQSVGNWLKSTPEGQTGLGQFLSGNVANIAGLLNPIGAPFLSLGGSAAGSTNPYKINNPFNINFGQTFGQDWNRVTGMFGSTGSNIGGQISNFGGMLGKLLPGTSSAAGGSSNKGISNDIFGKNGLLDFSRFKIPNFKWPSANEILDDIIKTVKPKIPGLKWQVPNVGQILGQTWDRINPLNWKIPNPNQFLGQTWQKINELWWQIPNPGQFLDQTWQKIKELWWDIPTADSILGLILGKIGEFHWPWGPGPVGGGSLGGGGGAFGPPRGPASDAVALRMSAKSGVGSGYISQAMANRFTGISAFQPIANGLSDQLHYKFYMGDQKSDAEVWRTKECNCYDGGQLLENEASAYFGLSGGLQNGVWNGTSIPHTWSVIGGQEFDMAAKLIRGQWNHPAGPGTIHDFMTDIGPALEWMGYGGHQIDPVTALATGGNCFDMSLGAMIVASQLYGKPAEMVWGTWGDQSHVWAKLDGRNYDPLRRARDGTFNPPPQGPPVVRSQDTTPQVVHKHYHNWAGANFYGMDDFRNKIEGVIDDIEFKNRHQ